MNIVIRQIDQDDLPEADRIFRLAFGTFLGLPDPMAFAGDADFIASRWRAAPDAAIGAFLDDTLIGSNFAANWGSFGFFGPLTVLPEFWEKGVAQKLLAPTMDMFARWGTRQIGLFTFPHSPKHLGLYQKFGFWPQFLTPLMSKAVGQRATPERWSTYSRLPAHDRVRCLADCCVLTDALYPGLDLQSEVIAVERLRIGETVLIHEGDDLVAFAICHAGGGSEAGSGAAYMKFAAARPGSDAPQYFDRLLSACEAFAASRGLEQLVGGVNTSRIAAYRMMLERGFRTLMQGVAMQRGSEPGFNRADCFVIDDWR